MNSRNIATVLAFCMSLVATSLAPASYAQMPKSREQRLMALGKQLHVTRKQAKLLLPILNAEEPQLQAIRNDSSLSRIEKLRRLQAVHDRSTPRIKAILTPAQFQQLQAHRQQRRAQLMAAVKAQTQTQGSASRLK